MRPILLLLAIICAFVYDTEAQINYVHNGSFEDHWRCPNGPDQIQFANYWTAIDSINYIMGTDTFSNPNCTPEYSNACDVGGAAGVPSGFAFYHYARTGDGMAQVMTYYYDSLPGTAYFRDYLQGRLKHTLIAGTQYCVTFYAVLEQNSTYANNNIGAYLDDGTIDTTANCGLPQTTHIPQVNETSIVTDTLNWTKIQGVFTANGTEKFITIGNFFDADHTDTVYRPWTTGIFTISWYLIDDVSVIPLDAVANAGPDVTTVVGDSVWIGTNDGYVPCRWYTTAGVLIDSNNAGIYVHPTATTSYVMELEVCGMYSYDTVKVTVHPTGLTPALSEGEGGVAWVLMPNPARDEVTVRGLTQALSKGEGVAILRDMTGRALGVYELSGSTTSIAVSGWAAGVYVVEVSEGGIKTNLRLVKE